MAFGVFMHRSDSIYDDIPSSQYQFPKSYLTRAQTFVGDWIVYLEPTRVTRTRGYFAMRPIQEAVHQDLNLTKDVYDWVVDLCLKMGGDDADFVSFEKYAKAAESLITPSSAARALAAGAKNIERVDRLVQFIASSMGMHHDEVDETVMLVDMWLDKNRSSSNKN